VFIVGAALTTEGQQELFSWENLFRANLIQEETERYPLLVESMRQRHEIKMAKLPEHERYMFVT
jgi:hypothetical protein